MKLNEVTQNPAEGSVEPLKLSKVSTKRSKIKAAIKLIKYVITLPFNFLFISLSLGVFAQARSSRHPVGSHVRL